jgi:dienelactone hydrolase
MALSNDDRVATGDRTRDWETMRCRTPSTIHELSEGSENVFEGVWPDRVLTQVNRAELHSYTIECPRGQVLVCAGGGYVKLMHDREGVEVALWLNDQGYDAHVLVHRLPGAPDAAGPLPKDVALIDALAAVEVIGRDKALVLVGLSSGGHLAGAVACQPQVRAAGLIAAFAPLNANHTAYKEPPGKPDYAPPQKQAFYDDWPIGLAEQPHGVPSCPVFLAYALHDSPVPIEHALNFVRTARDLGLDLDAHVFGAAPHGFALRDREGTHSAWPHLAAGWLETKIAPAI